MNKELKELEEQMEPITTEEQLSEIDNTVKLIIERLNKKLGELRRQ